ncbi:MAG: hypothetical protein JXR39_14205, partial [Marinilabiliaceae bacterium]|nr:hypothetical protein [Marinilabiliaceae bacterium]
LLSIFEQNDFTDEREITKNYTYAINDDVMKNIVDVLHHAGTDPVERLELEKEQEALRVFEVGMQALKQTISQKDRELDEKERELGLKDQALNEKEKELSEKDQLIAELKRKLNEK